MVTNKKIESRILPQCEHNFFEVVAYLLSFLHLSVKKPPGAEVYQLM
jgi:hypothetical protein